MYYLTKFDDVIWSGFWVIPKITSANLCKPIHDIINYSIFICPFESGKCGKEWKKLPKFEHLENENSFSDEGKNVLRSFLRAFKKNFIAPFYGWGSTASRLQLLRGGSLVKKGKIADTSFTNTYFEEYLPMSACEWRAGMNSDRWSSAEGYSEQT